MGHAHRIIHHSLGEGTSVERRLLQIDGYPSKRELDESIAAAGLERRIQNGDSHESRDLTIDTVQITKLGEIALRISEGRTISIPDWRTMLSVNVSKIDPPNVFR